MNKSCLLAVAALCLTACTSKELVVLLPEEDGKTGNLVVSSSSSSSRKKPVELSEAYAAARTGGGLGSGLRQSALSADEVDARFAEVMGALPAGPVQFVIYFETDVSALSPRAMSTIMDVRKIIQDREAAELEVVGHTDTIGSLDDNDALSIARASAAREVLVNELDIPSNMVTVSGRGERELAEETPDNTASSLNRRVELRIR